MSDFTAKLIPCYSTVSGESPGVGDIRVAEIAINTADGKLFTRHTDGTIKEISGSGGGGGGGSIDDLEDIGNIQPRPEIDGKALEWLWDHEETAAPTTAGGWFESSADSIDLYKERADGFDIRPLIVAQPATGSVWMTIAAEGADLTTLKPTDFVERTFQSLTIIGDVVGIQLEPLAPATRKKRKKKRAARTQGRQLVITFENPAIAGSSFDNDVLIFDAALGKWVPQPLTTETISNWYEPDALPTGMAMIWNNANDRWEPGFPILSQGKNTSGINGSGRQTDGPDDQRYADDAAAVADGWTVESAAGDDSVVTVPVPAEFQAQTYFGTVLGDTVWVNTNGGVGVGSACNASSGGDIIADAGSCPLYLAFWSSDSYLRKAFTKVLGKEWRLRLEFSWPYNVAPGYVIELHFSQNTEVIYLIFGKQQAGASALPAGLPGKSGMVNNGAMNFATYYGWPSLPADGNAAYLLGSDTGEYATEGRGLNDLADVVVSGDIKRGSTLIWDPSNDHWTNGPSLIQWVPEEGDGDSLLAQVVLLMNFDGNLTDEIGNQLIPESGWTFTEGKFGQALEFPLGVDKQLNFPSQTGLSLTGNFCIEYWVYAIEVTGEHGHLSKRADTLAVNDWCIEVTDGAWRWMCDGATPSSINGGTLSINTWHHIAVSREGTTLRLFQDGVLMAAETAYGQPVTGNANPLRLGRAFVPDGNHKGRFDGLRITNGAARYTEPFDVPIYAPGMGGNNFKPTLPIDIHTDVDTSTDPPEDGEALVWDEALGQWVPKPMPAPGGGQKQSLATATTALLPGERTVIEFQTAGGAGILQKITASLPMWVVLYDSQEALVADWDRVMSVDPQVDSGVITELIGTEAGSWTVTPSPSYLLGDDNKIHGKVVSLHDTEAIFTTTLDIFALG